YGRGLFGPPEVHAGDEGTAPPAALPVTVVRPHMGDLKRVSVQPGTAQAYEVVNLYAQVSGCLEKQTVDIGDRVRQGQVLAVLDGPVLGKQLRKDEALVHQAEARVTQSKAKVDTAVADHKAGKAAVTQAEASAKSAAAWKRFRHKQLQRMEDLFATRSIEERLVDERKGRYERRVETQLSAQAAIATSKAQLVAAWARIEEANADLAEARAEVEVARAEAARLQVQIDFATVKAPFEGVITQRNFFRKDFIRA